MNSCLVACICAAALLMSGCHCATLSLESEAATSSTATSSSSSAKRFGSQGSSVHCADAAPHQAFGRLGREYYQPVKAQFSLFSCALGDLPAEHIMQGGALMSLYLSSKGGECKGVPDCKAHVHNTAKHTRCGSIKCVSISKRFYLAIHLGQSSRFYSVRSIMINARQRHVKYIQCLATCRYAQSYTQTANRTSNHHPAPVVPKRQKTRRQTPACNPTTNSRVYDAA